MFTGIVAAVGRIAGVTPSAGGARIAVDTGSLSLDDVAVGDSISVNGACLTAVAVRRNGFDADVSRETIACTTGFRTGDGVNLEKALRLADRLGGHLVTGHVDGVGIVTHCERVGDNTRFAIAAPAALAKYVARKGSIAVDGVSLTVNDVQDHAFNVNLIPHTLSMTTLGAIAAGARVNLEVDLLARYAERLQSGGAA